MEDIKLKDDLFYMGDINNPKAYIKIERDDDGDLGVVSTFVDNSLRGQGIAGKLTQEVIAYAEKENLKIIPVCPYTVKYFEKHEEYQGLLK